MLIKGSNNVLLSGFLFLLCLPSVSPLCTALVITYPDNGGPFVDRLVFKVIESDDQQVLALLNDEVDLIGDMIDPIYLPNLQSAEDIEVANVMRNGYGYLTIKTDKYPFNITDFRRAFAFALDKVRMCNESWAGLAVPQDSPIPRINPFSIEGQLPYTYYEANVELGNQMLDAAGFADVDSDGWREAPDESNFDIFVVAISASAIGMDTVEFAADALQALHIDATSGSSDFYGTSYDLWFHRDYDIAFLGASFTDFDIDWLAYDFWSENADKPFWNFPCWRNATYDSWRDQLLHATSYDEVYEAALKMQEIWIHACPEVICYENALLSAYRTDKFEGYVNSKIDGVPGWWTNYNVHLKDSEGGPRGGQFRWSNTLDLDTFNFMVTSSPYTMNILNNLYDSLIIQDPDGNDIPWLAENYTIEVHDDSPHVTEGHTRITFSLLRDAMWSDGVALTAEDVAFTLNYYREAPGNPYGADLSDMTAAVVARPYTVIVEFETESFWHLHAVGYKPIIPRHVFQEMGPDGWDTWNPSYDSLVTSGPFTVSEYVAGEFTELTANPHYFRGPDRDPPVLGLPSDFTYILESTGNVIVWQASDLNPVNYTVYRNGTVYSAGLWATGNITVDIDGLAAGVHNFTLCVFDASLNSASDTVWVTVIAPTIWSFGPLSPLSIVITIASSVVIVVTGGLLVSAKRSGRPQEQLSAPKYQYS